MRRFQRSTRWILIPVILAMTGCLSASVDPAALLRGTWVLDHAKTAPDIPQYYAFVVRNDDTFEITDLTSQVMERSTMQDVTDHDFNYMITVQTLYPNIVNKSSYAQWSVADGELTISFYTNAAMTTRYVTFVGGHP